MGSTRIVTVRDGYQHFYHADHLGGLNVRTDGEGNLKERVEYEPYGMIAKREFFDSEEVTPFYFTGKPLDDETGLYYFNARYYDPELGRFIQPDTIVPGYDNPQAYNRYSYCLNNPINRIDPSGNWSLFKFIKSVISGFVAAVAGALVFPFLGPIGAGIVAGAVSGFISGGWTEQGWNWKGAGIGAVIGGGFGALGGAAVSQWGAKAIPWLISGGAGISYLTGGWEGLTYFAGGMAGGLAGGAIGTSIVNKYYPNSWHRYSFKNGKVVKNQEYKSTRQLEIDIKPRARKIYKQGEAGPELEGAIYDGEFHPAKTAKGGEPVFRMYGGKSPQKGESWTPLDPREVDNPADFFGLPPENTKGSLIAGRLRPGAKYVELPASPIGQNQGGGTEYLLDNPSQDVSTELIRQWDFTQTYGNQ